MSELQIEAEEEVEVMKVQRNESAAPRSLPEISGQKDASRKERSDFAFIPTQPTLQISQTSPMRNGTGVPIIRARYWWPKGFARRILNHHSYSFMGNTFD